MAGAAAVALVALVVTLSVQAAVSRSQGRYWDCPSDAVPARTPGTVNFFVIGDWGRAGISPQKKVAKMMATVADCMPPAFIISTGDNFYSREWNGASRRGSTELPAHRPLHNQQQHCQTCLPCTNQGRL